MSMHVARCVARSWLVLLVLLMPVVALAESVPRADINPCDMPTPHRVFPEDGSKGVSVDARIVVMIDAFYVSECLIPEGFKIDLYKEGGNEPLKGKMVYWRSLQQGAYYFAFEPDMALEPNAKYYYQVDNPNVYGTFETEPMTTVPSAPMLALKITSATYREGSGLCNISYEVTASGAPNDSLIHIRAKDVPLSQDPYDFIIHTVTGKAASQAAKLSFSQTDKQQGTACNKTEICLRAMYQDAAGSWGVDTTHCMTPTVIPNTPKEEPKIPEPPPVDEASHGEPPPKDDGGIVTPDSPDSPDGSNGTTDNPIDVRVGCGCQSQGQTPLSAMWLGLLFLVLLLGRGKKVQP